jgi:hypothetical protein
MALDTEKIDAAVLGLLYLTLHDNARAWKSMDWDALSRLHDKGFIHDPVNKAKSVEFTDAGLKEAKRLCELYFGTPAPSPDSRGARAQVEELGSAKGVSGMLCRSAVDGGYFFRVYAADHTFTEYALMHDDLAVTISKDALASFYRIGEAHILDHSPAVLGREK